MEWNIFITCGPNGVKLEDFDTFFFFASWRCFPCEAKGEQLEENGYCSHVDQQGKNWRTYLYTRFNCYFVLYIYDIYMYICFEISDMSLTMFFKRKLHVLVGYSPNLFINQSVLSSYESCLHGYVAAYSKVKFFITPVEIMILIRCCYNKPSTSFQRLFPAYVNLLH